MDYYIHISKNIQEIKLIYTLWSSSEIFRDSSEKISFSLLHKKRNESSRIFEQLEDCFPRWNKRWSTHLHSFFLVARTLITCLARSRIFLDRGIERILYHLSLDSRISRNWNLLFRLNVFFLFSTRIKISNAL